MNVKNNDKNWVRKLRPIEEFYVRYHIIGSCMSSYLLNLSSKQLIEEEDVRTTLKHMFW